MRSALLVLSIATIACAHPRPVLYPDERMKTAGEVNVNHDVEECMAKAKAYLKANPSKPIARKTARGGVVGAFIGLVVGAFTGDYKRAVTESAAIGAAAGLAHGAYEAGSPDEIQRGYTNRCLAEKGYSVIGWK